MNDVTVASNGSRSLVTLKEEQKRNAAAMFPTSRRVVPSRIDAYEVKISIRTMFGPFDHRRKSPRVFYSIEIIL